MTYNDAEEVVAVSDEANKFMKDFLNTAEGDKWLKSSEGKEWMESQYGKTWLETIPGKEWESRWHI